MWNYTLEEAKPFAKYLSREVLFREAVIHFLVGETPDKKEERLKEEYRKLARKLGKELPEDFTLREVN